VSGKEKENSKYLPSGKYIYQKSEILKRTVGTSEKSDVSFFLEEKRHCTLDKPPTDLHVL
jgi:hypothetical protein